eukprot:scaffold5108_cov172-Amphora_coffeaeformis.AAC.2
MVNPNEENDKQEGGGEPEAKRRKSDAAPPAYGSQEYWENRYQRQFDAADPAKGGESTTETSPYHEWYYSYADLRPLIVPLLLGGRNDLQNILKKVEEETNEVEEEDVEEDDDEEEEVDIGEGNDEIQLCDSENANSDANKEEEALQDDSHGKSGRADRSDKDSSGGEDDDDDDDDEFVEVDGDDDDDGEEEEDAVVREGLSKKGPVSVLEVGCGDVPLGAGLALELKDLEESTEGCAATVVKQILCTDYSPTVVTTMKSKYKKFEKSEIRPPESADIGNVPLNFAVADARKLEYANGCFELILEKGTLDAMLSDKEEGTQNCVQIIRECARVLSVDGYIVLVSHLNAHTEPGLQWLSDVVFEGLRGGDPSASWYIEVHGNAEIQVDSSLPPSGSPGPAVYVIRKKRRAPNEPVDDAAIPIKFFSY